MALGNLFKSLLGGGSAPQEQISDPVEHKGFTIEAAPIEEDGKFRTAGYISGDLDGETRRVRFIRADQHSDLQTAMNHALTKGKQIIDEQGKGLLHKDRL